jgi:hypothetical protein
VLAFDLLCVLVFVFCEGYVCHMVGVFYVLVVSFFIFHVFMYGLVIVFFGEFVLPFFFLGWVSRTGFI